MAKNAKHHYFDLLFFILFFAPTFIQDVTGSRLHMVYISSAKRNLKEKERLLIGSVAPTCTYNECRGCRYKCRAEQVPVEGNDPINSAYHYKCVCHSSALWWVFNR